MVLGLWQQQIAFRGKSNNKEAKYYIITMIYKYYKTSFLCSKKISAGAKYILSVEMFATLSIKIYNKQ